MKVSKLRRLKRLGMKVRQAKRQRRLGGNPRLARLGDNPMLVRLPRKLEKL
jgi:hypothetical protein